MHIHLTGAVDREKIATALAMARPVALSGDTVSISLVGGVTEMGSKTHTDLPNFSTPGGPTVQEIMNIVRANEALGDFLVHEETALERGISREQLRKYAQFAPLDDIYEEMERHETVLTF